MTDRTRRLREASLAAEPFLSEERARLLTEFYTEQEGRHAPPILRALAWARICDRQTIRIGPDELIVGDRGPAPKAVPTFPELTCHSLEDLRVLDGREKTRYAVPESCATAYRDEVIPFWRGRTMRDRIFEALPPEWHALYEAGVFTEFMEQRAPGHAVLDGKVYREGLRGRIARIEAELARLADEARDVGVAEPGGALEDRRHALVGMAIACEATIRLARRHADLAARMASEERDPCRRAELRRIDAICRHVPGRPPRDFHEALQAYWFCHLGVITELNGWDAFSPGHLDQHLLPFYRRGLAEGSLSRDSARELLEAFFVKFNDHPAPPKVGVTAAESGTYTDFANITFAGLDGAGEDASSGLTELLLEIAGELRLVQPSTNVLISRHTPDRVLHRALEVIRRGDGFPSLFNADVVVEEQLRMGKTPADAREGGCSGCVETSAFGKESCVLTGYFNLPKVLELALHDGVDPRTGRRLGPPTGLPERMASFDDLFEAFDGQLRHAVEAKLRGNRVVERLYAEHMPAPFLSALVDGCIESGRDYNAGGARYHNRYVQMVGIGTITDSLSAIRRAVFEERRLSLAELVAAADRDYADAETLRLRLANRVPRWGNDEDAADDLMRRVFESAFAAVDGKPTETGGRFRIQMLPTTSHVYFGSVTGATADGRRAGRPLSEGISPVQGADRSGPTAVLRSAAKMDHRRTGGTLLNMKLTPATLEGEEGIEDVAALVRAWFAMGGHHIQFNVVRAETLRAAQAEPEVWRDLIVRVAGYSDYFCDLSPALQEEIIARTEHAGAEASI
jgi:formate C-acetyltransferase